MATLQYRGAEFESGRTVEKHLTSYSTEVQATTPVMLRRPLKSIAVHTVALHGLHKNTCKKERGSPLPLFCILNSLTA